jgi:hypothetical protein
MVDRATAEAQHEDTTGRGWEEEPQDVIMSQGHLSFHVLQLPHMSRYEELELIVYL